MKGTPGGGQIRSESPGSPEPILTAVHPEPPKRHTHRSVDQCGVSGQYARVRVRRSGSASHSVQVPEPGSACLVCEMAVRHPAPGAHRRPGPDVGRHWLTARERASSIRLGAIAARRHQRRSPAGLLPQSCCAPARARWPSGRPGRWPPRTWQPGGQVRDQVETRLGQLPGRSHRHEGSWPVLMALQALQLADVIPRISRDSAHAPRP